MLHGIVAATLTPITAALEPDAATAIPYYRELLERGCDGLAILGTTGEAMSFSVRQRMTFMEAVARALPMDRLACGTGAASLADAVQLTQAACDLGFIAALLMPPFFYRDAGDDGIVRFFDALLSRVNAAQPRVLLYNFPRMSGITFHAALVDRLTRAFPSVIVGMKDSSNDRALQQDVIARHPAFRVFPGSEHYLADAKAYGVAGCISGSVCLWPELARDVFESGDAEKNAELARLRESLAGKPLNSAVRRRVTEERNDVTWLRSMPPLPFEESTSRT